MQRGNKLAQSLRQLALIGSVVMLAACVALEPQPVPEEPSSPPEIIEPEIPVVETVPAPSPPAKAVPEPVVVIAPPPGVAVVLSRRDPLSEEVVSAIATHFDVDSTHDISDKSQTEETVFRLINDSEVSAVIAFGLQASRLAVTMADAPVVFSQVFNYQDHELLTENSRGIAVVPPLDAQIGAWQEIDPGLSRIGIIIGEGHEELIAEAEIAAQRHGVALTAHVSHSDQETQFVFKRMVREIDGFWLFPDNRILSLRVLREMLKEANRRNIAVLVPNDAMLSMGAAISITPIPTDVADRIAEVVGRIQADGLAAIPSLTSLSEMRIATNDGVLRRRVFASSNKDASDSAK